MIGLARRRQRDLNHWPGFVDALATLLMVIIFLLMIFVIAQVFLGAALSGRDEALDQLTEQINELTELLALERGTNVEMAEELAALTAELTASARARDDLIAQVSDMSAALEAAQLSEAEMDKRLQAALQALTRSQADLAGARETVSERDRALAEKAAALAALERLIAEREAALEARDTEIAARDATIAEQRAALARSEEEIALRTRALEDEKEISRAAQRQVALLNQQIAALRAQLTRVEAALDAAEAKAEEQQIQIVNLGNRLNAALATKVAELQRYRSEFFGRLREVLGNRQGIRIVGDRFVFQSEVLFASGSAELGEGGKLQIERLADTLIGIASEIPDDLDWVLRVDGHTDKVPIHSVAFPSNWELSAARAISVVKFLIERGVPANRLVAAGFGEFQPIDPRDDEIALRRNRRIELKLTQR